MARTHAHSSPATAALLVALAFALGFAEFVLIGIAPAVAEGIGEPITLIGDIVGFYALACAIATPVVSLTTAHASRLKLTAVLLVVFNAGNLLTLFADSYLFLLVSRLLPAITSGTLLAIALTYVPDIVDKEKVARVISFILAGFSVSSVIGVPIGTLLATAFDWKAAYVGVFALGLLVSVVLLPALPRTIQATSGTFTLRSQLQLILDKRVLLNIAMILTAAASTYAFYTYLTPVLEDIMGFHGIAVSVILLVLGAACVGSNLLSGWVANQFGLRALPLAFILHAAFLALLAVSTPVNVAGLVNIVGVCLLMYVMNATVQMLFQNVARTDYPRALTFSASLHPMSFNAGIALGAFTGGIAVQTGGLLAIGPVGALFALAAAGFAFVLVRVVALNRCETKTGEHISNEA